MRPNKIETDFKNQLNQREIKPTEQAWDRLDAMLTVAEEKKPKRKYAGFFIAASVVVFIGIGISFFTQNNKAIEINNNEVVIGNNKKEIPAQEKTIIPIDSETESAVAISVHHNEKGKKQAVIPILKENKTIAKNQNPIAENIIINKQDEQKIEQQSAISKTNPIVETVNIEKPLNAKNPVVKVDAKSLLSQVDGELDLTFREKVLQTVGANYKTIKVAIANRNQE